MPLITLSQRMAAYISLTRLDRPIGIYLVLWPTLWALWFAAGGVPDLLVLGVFLAGIVLMRSAGCAINDYADRKVDPHVSRTKLRPLAAGTISPKEALLLFGGLSLLALVLVLQLNRLTVLLAIPAVILAGSYPFAKRFTHLPQAWLGVAFGWAVPMAFAAQTGTVPVASWWVFAATVAWALAYDTMYAITDREDDLKIGVKSTAILFGRWDRFWIGLFEGGVWLCLWQAGVIFATGTLFIWGLGVVSVGFIGYHQWLIRDRDPALCFRAFLNSHYYGMAVFLLLMFDLMWVGS